jgi:uncharacterized protein (TIGR02594 family)
MSLERAFEIAGQNLGMNEREQNAALQEFMRNGGQNLDPAVTAWCAAYVNASLQQAGLEGTGRLNARSFMEWGQPTEQPQRGDLAVFSRGDPNGWQGHVGFFDGYGDDGRVRVLGGNQGDAVSLAYYDPARLLGFRTAGENTGASPLQNTMLAGGQSPGGPQAAPGAPMLGAPPVGGEMPDLGLAGLFGGGAPEAPMNVLPQRQRPQRNLEAERTQRRRQALFGAGGLADIYG